MKILVKKSFAVLLALVMCASMFFGVQITSYAADSTVNYINNGDYIYNWGQRDVDATFLSPKAIEFYQNNNIAYSKLAELSGSSDLNQIANSELYQKLYETMSSKHTTMTSYGDTREMYQYTDCENSNTSEISLFYSGTNVASVWDSETYTREHTWPDSKGTSTSDVTNTTRTRETDIIMLRPVLQTNNSSRGNTPYGNSGNSAYFFPNCKTDTYDVRGDVARAILYVYVRWGGDATYSDGALDYMWGENGVIESKDVLLEWMAADPVDTWEMGRNDSTEAITGTRNIFIDYPELAFELFEETVPSNFTSPSGGKNVEGTGGASTSVEATITFDADKTQRTSYSTTQQVWANGGATFTNDKSSSTTNVADYGAPVRLYKSSSITIAFTGANITKIVFNTNTAAYATELKNSIGDEATVNNKTVTVIPTASSDTYTISSLTAQIRLDDVTVYAQTASGGDSGDDGGDTPDIDEPTDPTPDPEPEDPDEPTGTPVDVTIDFSNINNRVASETTYQVWTENGITVTNNKGSSSNPLYTTATDHIRFYKGNQIVTEYEHPITKIVFTTVSNYTTTLANSLTSSGLGTVTTSGTIITLELTTPTTTVAFEHVNNVTRVKSMTITALVSGNTEPEITITAQSNNDSYGTVEIRGKYITATPATGYEVDSTNPYTIISGNNDANITRDGNIFTVDTTENVTVQVNFVPRAQYTVTFKEMGTVTDTQTVYSGDDITLPSITSDDYAAAGWVAEEIDGETAEKPTIYGVGDAYTVSDNVTLYALYSRDVAGGSGESNVFTKHTGALTEGDYIIVYSGNAMKAAISGNRFEYTSVGTADSIDSPDASLVWKISQDGSYWTLYNESTSKYAAGNGTKNQAKIIASVDNYARWTVTGNNTYEFVNLFNSTKATPVNANLRYNDGYGFACYSTGTGGALTLYKRTDAAIATIYFTNPTQAVFEVAAQPNNAEYGNVSVIGTTVSATPNEGYAVTGYEIVSGDATVTQEGATFFVTPLSNVEITIVFEALPVYTVTFVENGVTVGSESKYSNGQITLPNYSGELDENTTFDGWAVNENETDKAKIFAAGSPYAVTGDITLYAQYTVTVIETADHNFVKVTENLDDWTGSYLIVYEADNKALNGAISEKLDITNNNIDVQITDDKIAAIDSTMLAIVTIEKIDGGYTLRTKSGLFFGSENDTNSMLSHATKTYVNTISVDEGGNAVITGEGGAILRYNAASNQNRFRFYKTDSYTGQKAIALYKLDVADISGAQVSVGADLSVNYYVSLKNPTSEELNQLKMRFTLEGKTPLTVTANLEKVDDKYCFVFDGIAPQRMGDTITAELLFDENVINTVSQYSVKQNAINLLNNEATTSTQKQFITDMLYYGAAAQSYSGYNKNNLVTDGITGLGEPLDEPLTEEYSCFNLTAPSGNAAFKSATVWFDAVNRLIVKVKNPDSETVKVYATIDGSTRTELTYNEDVGGYMTEDISVTNFNTAYVFELCDKNNNVIQTLTYSVNSYAYSKQSSSNPKMVDLALALFRLGQSAENI